jgi:methylated-DNA-[protein]-cysteine S-methyltransferase
MTVLENPALDEKDEWWVMPTPVGQLMVVGDNDHLHAVALPGSFDADGMDSDRQALSDSVASGVEQLEAYFDGELLEFDVPMEMPGTAFQQSVWRALRAIPYGTTQTYGEVAARVGKPKACRAVGLANGRNPIPVIVPCHRVVGANGNLTGYGRGLELLDVKRWLIDHEARTLR